MTNIKLPSNINFELGQTLFIKINKPWLNMQDDSAAFEAWIIALKANKNIEVVILDFDLKCNPTENEILHQNRFLFRLINFRNMFQEWFYIHNNKMKIVNDFKKKLYSHPIVNAAIGVHEIDSISKNEKKSKIKDICKNENKLEHKFLKHGELKKKLSCDVILRQIPVGVFDTEISNVNKIFPGGKSAIDLMGIDNKNNILHLIELKAIDNYKMGIISESLFYIFVLHNIFVSKQFKLENFKQFEGYDPYKLYTIKGHFLCGKYHPFLNGKTLDLLNEGLNLFNMSFDKLQYRCDGDDPVLL